MAEVLDWKGAKRFAAAHGVIDETVAVSLAQPDRERARLGFLVTFASIFLTWNATTLAGALATERIGDPDTLGLDAVGPAIFLALLWPRLREGARERRVALLGVVIAMLAAPFLPPGVPVLLAALAALAGLGGGRPEKGN